MGHDCFPIGFAMGSLCFVVDFMVVCNDLILFSFMGDGGFVFDPIFMIFVVPLITLKMLMP